MELLFELLFEGSLALSINRRVPKWIRYPLILLIILFFLFVIGCLFLIGIFIYTENKLVGILFVVLAVFILICSIYKFFQVYIKGRRL